MLQLKRMQSEEYNKGHAVLPPVTHPTYGAHCILLLYVRKSLRLPPYRLVGVLHPLPFSSETGAKYLQTITQNQTPKIMPLQIVLMNSYIMLKVLRVF